MSSLTPRAECLVRGCRDLHLELNQLVDQSPRLRQVPGHMQTAATLYAANNRIGKKRPDGVEKVNLPR